MGVIDNFLGAGKVTAEVGRAAERVSEVFIPNATKKQEHDYMVQKHAMDQFGGEFKHGSGLFDAMVDGLNRLPRPIMAFSTVGLFAFAMINPLAFGERMRGLALVPDALWWLLSAIVSFYFGARELHHFRHRQPFSKPVQNISAVHFKGDASNKSGKKSVPKTTSATLDETADKPEYSNNAALDDWYRTKSDA